MRAGRRSAILAAVSTLQFPLDEPLSPELALVCPELAERARRLLPEPSRLRPAAFRFESTVRRSAPERSTGRLLAFVLFVVCVLVTVAPLIFVALTMRGHTVHR
jgi:hypothetical protein